MGVATAGASTGASAGVVGATAAGGGVSRRSVEPDGAVEAVPAGAVATRALTRRAGADIGARSHTARPRRSAIP